MRWAMTPPAWWPAGWWPRASGGPIVPAQTVHLTLGGASRPALVLPGAARASLTLGGQSAHTQGAS